jgi:hypothetical protein
MRVAKKALSNALTLAIRMRYCFWRFKFYEPSLCTSLYKCLSSPWLRKSNEVSPNFDLEQTEIVQMGKKKKRLFVCVCVTWKPSTNWLCYPWTTKDKSNEAKLNGDMTLKSKLKSVFDSVVAGAFQITFRAKIHVNNIFLFFKNYFWHQLIKTIQNVQIILNFSKKKNSNFLGTQPQPLSQTFYKSRGGNYKKKNSLGCRRCCFLK